MPPLPPRPTAAQVAAVLIAELEGPRGAEFFGGPAPMADPVTGTNTEKIDQLAAQVADLRVQVAEMKSAVRVVTWAVSLTLPLLTSLIAFLVYHTITLTAEVRSANDRLGRIEDRFRDTDRELREQRERLIKLEAADGKRP